MTCCVAITTLHPQNSSHAAKWKLSPLNHPSLPPPASPWHRPLAVLHSVSVNLAALGTLCAWAHTGFVLLCLAYLTQHHVLPFHTCRSRCENSLPKKVESFSITGATPQLLDLCFLFTDSPWVQSPLPQDRDTPCCLQGWGPAHTLLASCWAFLPSYRRPDPGIFRCPDSGSPAPDFLRPGSLMVLKHKV